jgi:transketolase C-terminal domain/subunit
MEELYLLDEVYDFFLSSITDYTFISNTITDDELEETLFSYFKKARIKFRKCKNNLSTYENEEGKQYLAKKQEDGTIVATGLTADEVNILAQCMLIEYMKQQLFSTETLKQSLSDKDFRIYSQANQLRELNLLYRLTQKEANKLITQYTYLGMTDKK